MSIALYTQSSSNSNAGFNWNSAANDRYAWQFTPSATGTPTELRLHIASISGTPTGDFYIKSNRTLASTTYGSATGVTLTAGENVIALTGGSEITASTGYWVFFVRTSTTASGFPRVSIQTTLTNYQMYRATAANADPTVLWFTNDLQMIINGDAPSAGGVRNPLFMGGGL